MISRKQTENSSFKFLTILVSRWGSGKSDVISGMLQFAHVNRLTVILTIFCLPTMSLNYTLFKYSKVNINYLNQFCFCLPSIAEITIAQVLMFVNAETKQDWTTKAIKESNWKYNVAEIIQHIGYRHDLGDESHVIYESYMRQSIFAFKTMDNWQSGPNRMLRKSSIRCFDLNSAD